eukprot:CAMPEP_0184323252 /NCGR_PEP_ID=MMETSP1049-20130417/129399_1 /TAXON_ID=77928 /ORGANISM="Proteomonas sulcata, Strain CCMP704" /LENGTH=85 /DNA_ID=CAMNT_0026644703 /DNA_START=39 /DNA_END=293 /DNA_ORIENTATION=-
MDKNGKLNITEFAEVCLDLRVGVSNREIKKAFQALDLSGEGFITIRKFSEWWNAGLGDAWANLNQVDAMARQEDGQENTAWHGTE